MVTPGQFFVLFAVGTWSTSWGELAAFVVVVVVVVVYAFMFSFTSTSHSLQVITYIILDNIYYISYCKSYKSSDAMPTIFHISSRKYPMGSRARDRRTNEFVTSR